MFLIQDGHQTATRVGPTLAAELADGVIWSPGDQTPDGLGRCIEATGDTATVQAVDPQMYVAVLQDANPKRLARHELFPLPMAGRDFGAQRMAATVDRVLEFQRNLATTHIIAPTVSVSSMTSRSAQVAFNLAETALDSWDRTKDDRPLLLSAALEQSLLDDEQSVDSLLDELSVLEPGGFYLLFEIPPRLDASRQAQLLERALYIVHTLGVVNGYPVWVGYAGLTGYLYRAAGAEVSATGWFQKQQWWSLGHWTSTGGGGRQPRPRIYLDTLLGSLLLDTELSALRRQRRDGALFQDVLAGAGTLAREYARGHDLGPQALDRAVLTEQLFSVCAELESRISGDSKADLGRVRQDIEAAQERFYRIERAGIGLEPRSAGGHLSAWDAAIGGLADRI